MCVCSVSIRNKTKKKWDELKSASALFFIFLLRGRKGFGGSLIPRIISRVFLDGFKYRGRCTTSIASRPRAIRDIGRIDKNSRGRVALEGSHELGRISGGSP